ncbi:MAG: oxidoreductase [Pseudomonadota bacterium]
MKTLKRAADLPSQQGKLAVITGGNRGLGFEVAAGLAAAGAQVVLACRDMEKAQGAAERLLQLHPVAQVEAMPLDIADLASVRRFAQAFETRFAKLDLLIHNAAAIMVPQGKTANGFELHLGTNHFGPFALTGLLLARLNAAPAARIVNLSSLAHRLHAGLDMDDPGLNRRPYRPMDAYGRSKFAALLFTQELDRRLKASGARTMAVAAHPGYTATNLDIGGFFLRLTTRLFAQAPAAGALPILFAATSDAVRGGEYFGPGGYKELGGAPKQVECSAEARDPHRAQQLWALSERLTGVRYLDA